MKNGLSKKKYEISTITKKTITKIIISLSFSLFDNSFVPRTAPGIFICLLNPNPLDVVFKNVALDKSSNN
jgi:hypothetical protein